MRVYGKRVLLGSAGESLMQDPLLEGNLEVSIKVLDAPIVWPKFLLLGI